MAETKTYIGITIGPIFDTMSLVSKPSALWASSYIFSYVSKELCRILVNDYNIPKENIVSPFYDENSNYIEEANKKGIGLFHDRIVFEKPKEFRISEIKAIKRKIINIISERFSICNEDFLNEYIMVAAAEFDAENPIIGSGKVLDSLELSKSFVRKETENPILKVFTSDSYDKGQNEVIKKIVREKLGISNWQLLKGDNIKDLGTIAKTDILKMKYNDYFAVVRSDGDNMSKIISSFSSKEEFRNFSGTCFSYCAQAASLVAEYRGVTIYSGGDDLLALIPCRIETEDTVKTVFDFTDELVKLFNQNFNSYITKIFDENCKKDENEKTPLPSLSTAVYICYKKFPLYEVINNSASLLFDTAKSKKNCLAIYLQKHSGQSCGLVIPNCMIPEIIDIQTGILGKSVNVEEKVLLSASQKLSLFEDLFNLANDSQVDNIFKNTFDADFHKGNNFVHKTLPNFYKKIDVNSFSAFDETGIKKNNRALVLSDVLKIFKFYIETGGEKD